MLKYHFLGQNYSSMEDWGWEKVSGKTVSGKSNSTGQEII